MYKSFTASDYLKHHKLPQDYHVDGFIIYGTFHPGPYEVLKDELSKLDADVSYQRTLDGPYFEPILEFIVNGKRYWFTIAYGGTMLSEWTHLACLFGSKSNIVIGSCGGLFKDANEYDIVVPTHAYANESATRMYEPNVNNKHHSDETLNQSAMTRLKDNHTIWHGPTVTCQAMMAETWEDVQNWSASGYYAVEMEAATVFAVSNHFNVSAAALLVIGDNLVKDKTVLDVNYESGLSVRHGIRREMLAVALKLLLEDDNK